MQVDNIAQTGQGSRDSSRQKCLSVNFLDCLCQSRIHECGTHDLSKFFAFFFTDIGRGHLGLDQADQPRQRKPLNNQRTRCDEEGDGQKEGTHGRCGGNRLCCGKSDGSAHSGPDNDTGFTRPKRLFFKVIDVGSAHCVLPLGNFEAAPPAGHGFDPLFFTEVSACQNLAVHGAGLCHSLLEGFEAPSLGLVAPLTVLAAVVEPSEHECDEECTDHHNEAARNDGNHGGSCQSAAISIGVFNDAKCLQPHCKENPTLKHESHGRPVLLRKTPILRGNHACATTGNNKTGNDRGNQSRATHMLGRDRSNERHCKGKDRIRRRIFDDRTNPNPHFTDD